MSKKCPKCGNEHPEDNNYCETCAVPLVIENPVQYVDNSIKSENQQNIQLEPSITINNTKENKVIKKKTGFLKAVLIVLACIIGIPIIIGFVIGITGNSSDSSSINQSTNGTTTSSNSAFVKYEKPQELLDSLKSLKSSFNYNSFNITKDETEVDVTGDQSIIVPGIDYDLESNDLDGSSISYTYWVDKTNSKNETLIICFGSNSSNDNIGLQNQDEIDSAISSLREILITILKNNYYNDIKSFIDLDNMTQGPNGNAKSLDINYYSYSIVLTPSNNEFYLLQHLTRLPCSRNN